MIDYMKPHEIANGPLQNYCFDVLSARELVTMYQLEHPNYETEEEYGMILEAWKALRSGWTMEAKEQGRDEYLPKPKRRPGRPVNQQALEERRRAEAERKAAREAREAEKAEAREARKRRVEERERLQREKADRKRGAIPVALRLPDHVASGIFQIKGELTIADCIIQLLEHALGPLAQKK